MLELGRQQEQTLETAASVSAVASCPKQTCKIRPPSPGRPRMFISSTLREISQASFIYQH